MLATKQELRWAKNIQKSSAGPKTYRRAPLGQKHTEELHWAKNIQKSSAGPKNTEEHRGVSNCEVPQNFEQQNSRFSQSFQDLIIQKCKPPKLLTGGIFSIWQYFSNLTVFHLSLIHI